MLIAPPPIVRNGREQSSARGQACSLLRHSSRKNKSLYSFYIVMWRKRVMIVSTPKSPYFTPKHMVNLDFLYSVISGLNMLSQDNPCLCVCVCVCASVRLYGSLISTILTDFDETWTTQILTILFWWRHNGFFMFSFAALSRLQYLFYFLQTWWFFLQLNLLYGVATQRSQLKSSIQYNRRK